jgi:hypothetical protein
MSKPVTPHETAALARKLLVEALDHPVQGIAIPRYAQLIHIIGALDGGSYAAEEDRLVALSIIPFVFQEANWDGIDWWARDSSKHHRLKEILEIDFLTQMAGKRRADASDAEIETYRLRSHRAIDHRRA